MTHRAAGPVEWAPVTPERYQEWLAPVRDRLVEQRTRTGVPVAEAAGTVDRVLATWLPEGAGTPDQRLLTARVGGEPVGQAWIELDGRTAFLHDLGRVSEPPAERGESRPFAREAAAGGPADGVTDAASGHPGPPQPARGTPAHTLAGERLLPTLERYAAGLGAGAIKITVLDRDRQLARWLGGRGYRVVNTQMRLVLADAADAGPRRELREMTADQWTGFRANQERDYVAEMLRAGQCRTAAEATERAVREMAELLPAGRDTPDQRFLMAHADGEPVGHLWYSVDPGSAFVLDLLVYEQHRRRGHAAGMMRAMHDRCRDAGLATVGLSVFGFNDGARALYDDLGYRATEQVLVRPLD